MNTITENWKRVGYKYSEHGEHCEHCNADIKHIFVIQDEFGVKMHVGSECVKTLTNGAIVRVVASLEKIAKSAASQWRKRSPAPRRNETREEYINRRVAEMPNSHHAYRELLAQNQKLPHMKDERVIARYLRMNKIVKPGLYEFPARWHWDDIHTYLLRSRELRRIFRLARKHGANAWDFAKGYITR